MGNFFSGTSSSVDSIVWTYELSIKIPVFRAFLRDGSLLRSVDDDLEIWMLPALKLIVVKSWSLETLESSLRQFISDPQTAEFKWYFTLVHCEWLLPYSLAVSKAIRLTGASLNFSSACWRNSCVKEGISCPFSGTGLKSLSASSSSSEQPPLMS